MIPSCMEICKGLKDDGYDPTFVNARFVKPLDVDLLDELAKDHSLFVTVEENVKSGGYGEHVSAYMEACHPEIRVLSAAVWDRFVPQGNVESLRSRIGLGVEDIRQAIEDSEEIKRAMKKRLDMLMMERALAPSREKAKAFIMAGDVYVDGQKEDKAGTMFPETVKIEVRGNTLPYVSRGGLKLEKAMKNFDVTLDSKVCMDVGASTGGFTDCMLQNGAVKVYSIDVGYGQLDWKLRNDPRVVCMEKTNIRYVVPEDLGEPADFFINRCVLYFSYKSTASCKKSPYR